VTSESRRRERRPVVVALARSAAIESVRDASSAGAIPAGIPAAVEIPQREDEHPDVDATSEAAG